MFSRKISDYVASTDFTNHLQVKIGDVVSISEAAFTQLSREKHFWRTVIIGGGLTACTMGLATGFVGVGIVGSELAVGLTAAELAAGAGVVGGTASAFVHQTITDAHVRRATLKMMPFVGKVTRIHKKTFSELHHVEVEFYIPNNDGGYDIRTEWVDAHHLMGLITKFENDQRTAEMQRKAADAQRKYDAKLKKKHRTQFAPENVSLMQELQDAKSQRNVLAGLAPFALLLLLI